ncbi:carboxypeptidase-like regulatory domain-containing protein [Galbibacter pacificus]|uniref:Carboxypeptidase-like regulatory domain-containing protein n=1 Tax=Galbibacter pacificus TaxID=2996052 RepID=A0ABT6FPX8_9FLAO|nr:carboxypeptidase-like regulatory domain-containing protein [Galbibacter pacificus]MDG3582353.1 carboxypeptidase-like regulatory domain-containing protein [Galbibacter pacificus]MDG3585171.1 carboxypeptidase-like regulatory domain-containing protein [Galbibacter pacificus]
MKYHYYFFVISAFLGFKGFSQQSISAKIIDSATQKPVPFATITLNDKIGVVSAEDGMFILNMDQPATEKDSLFISCLGYQERRIAATQVKNPVIYLNNEDIELDEIVLLNRELSVDEIMERVEDSLEKNYDTDYVEQKVFYRASDYNHIIEKNVKIKESSIPEINQAFVDSLTNNYPNDFAYHVEILGNLYGKMKAEEQQVKLDIIKACELYDKDNELTFDAVEEKLQGIMRKHVKRDSYFKIKSGIIGGKTEIDSSFFEDDADTLVEAQRKKEKEKKENFLKYRTGSISGFLKDNFIYEDTDFNVIHKSRKYNFELKALTYLNDDLVYKLSFEPRGGADYKGMLYVNADDFAVIRIDYENVKPLKKFNLFGVSYMHYQQKGTFLYAKNNRDKYSLKYQEETEAHKIGFDRPIKIIEKNKHVKGRRKQNEVSTHLDFTLTNTVKRELVVFETDDLQQATFDDFEPKPDIIPTYLPNYDPSFWEGYNIIAPNDAIKQFKSMESDSK